MADPDDKYGLIRDATVIALSAYMDVLVCEKRRHMISQNWLCDPRGTLLWKTPLTTVGKRDTTTPNNRCEVRGGWIMVFSTTDVWPL